MKQCMDADNLHRRLKKIIGQVQAIDRMIDEDVPCEDILSQINAAKSALNGCGKVVLEVSLCICHVISPFRAFLFTSSLPPFGQQSKHARKKAPALPHLPETIRYLWGICPFSFFSKILYTIFQPTVLPQQSAPCFSIVIFDSYSLFSLCI